MLKVDPLTRLFPLPYSLETGEFEMQVKIKKGCVAPNSFIPQN